jgi:hypothetical protein
MLESSEVDQATISVGTSAFFPSAIILQALSHSSFGSTPQRPNKVEDVTGRW